jgi:osmoprotectant transport system permease protein
MRAAVVSLLVIALIVGPAVPAAGADIPIVVGSKNFNESYNLGEIVAQLLEDRGYTVERKFGLGGTLIGFEALRNKGIDVYVEYSGTLAEAILKLPQRTSYPELQKKLRDAYGMELLGPFGFSNTYAIALRRSQADRLKLKKISDLPAVPGLRYGFSPDFMNRHDCWPGLYQVYKLDAQPIRIEHGLAYEALAQDKLDITDAYSTDGDIKKFDLVLLQDDSGYFPKYLGAPLVRADMDGQIKSILNELAGTLNDEQMAELNARVILQDGESPEVIRQTVARDFLREHGLLRSQRPIIERGFWSLLWERTLRHLQLMGIALAAGIVVAIPLGIVVYRFGRLGQPVVYLTGAMQTIPSIALLAFMIPLFDIGQKPAIAALFLYSLLPIVRNTATALFSIDPVLKKVSVGIGLTAWQRLRYVELPLAAPTILGGIKTAAIINIGTATLAAFIGAGGLGEPIVTGLALHDQRLILQGAIPAALLAIGAEIAFSQLERWLIPRHLLQKAAA